MASEWCESTIGDLCDAGVAELQTGPFGSQLHAHDYVVEGVPVVPTEAIRDRRIDHSVLPKISSAKAGELARHRLRPRDILFARRGVQATGHIGCIREEEDGFICGTGAIRLRIDHERDEVDADFLSHVLANPASVEWFKFHAIGATMPNLNESIIRSFPLAIPPLVEQRTIARILGTLDDKIELSRRMDKTLEAMARAIFKSWFVDFDPVRAKAEGRDPGLPKHIAELFPDSFEDSELGEIPVGWEMGKVEKFATLSRDSINPGDFPNETFAHFSIPAFDEGQTPRRELGETIKSNKFLIPSDAILLSKLNPRIPRLWLPVVRDNPRAICSTEFLVVLPRIDAFREFIYGLLSSGAFADVFETLVTGTSGSHQRVRPEGLLSINVVIPDKSIIHHFSKIVQPLLTRTDRSREESQTLAALRERLLPKLISGELRVSAAESILQARA